MNSNTIVPYLAIKRWKECQKFKNTSKQAEAELGKAQVKLEVIVHIGVEVEVEIVVEVGIQLLAWVLGDRWV